MNRLSCCHSWVASLLLVVIQLRMCSSDSDIPDSESSMESIHCDPKRPIILTEEQRLMRYLVGEYDPSVRPVYDASKAVDIDLGLALTQILDLDEKNQVLTVNVWLEALWHDERLNWSSVEFGGISSIRVPCHKIWLPDIVLYNSVDDYTSGYMPSLAMVYNDSRVFWGPVIRFRSACNIDITYFPFDNQVCKLKMGSWAYNGLQVNVFNNSHTMDLSNFVDNGEWELLGIKVKRNVVFYPCCEEPFPDVTFTIKLRRRTKYYFMNIIIPCIILSFLCLGGFLLPPESGEKITLGLSVLLTITVFMLMVADKMPQTSESISVISIYLMVVLATSCMSVLSSVLVLSIHHKRGRPTRAPAWLRWLCFKFVAKLLRLSRRHHYGERNHSIKSKDVDESGDFRSASWNRKRNRYQPGKKDSFNLRNNMTTGGSTDEESEFLKMHSKVNFSNHDNISDRPTKERSPHRTGTTAATNASSRHWGKSVQNQHPRPTSQCRSSQPHFSSYRELESDTSFTIGNETGERRDGHLLGSDLGVELIDDDDAINLSDNDAEPEDVEIGTKAEEDEQEEKVDNSQKSVPSRGKNAFRTYGVVIRQLIALIQTKQNDEIKDEEIFQEWHDVAYVLDRLLFVLFFFVTLISTVGLLWMRPVPSEGL